MINSKSFFYKNKEKILAFLMVLPSLFVIFFTYLYPAIFTFIISFAEFDLIRLSIKKFVGFKNFNYLFSSYFFQGSVIRTIYFGLLILEVAYL